MKTNTEKELIQLLKITISDIQKAITKTRELYHYSNDEDLPEIEVMQKAMRDFKSILKMYK